MRGWAALFALAAAACGARDSHEPPAVLPHAPDVQAPEESAQVITARIRAIDSDGNPLAGLIPLATTQANAFDRPVATGESTDAAGRGALYLPKGQRVYVRAWDPARARYANNYFEVLPTSGGATETMDIVMIEAASLRVRVLTPEGNPASGTVVQLTLFHPTEGEWWPDRATADRAGGVTYPSLPPGRYTVRLEIEGVGRVEVPEVMLPPGGEASAGDVRLLKGSESAPSNAADSGPNLRQLTRIAHQVSSRDGGDG